MKAPSGLWAGLWRGLSHPNTSWSLLVLLGAGAAAGLTVSPERHPALSAVMQAPAVLLPYAVLAWALAHRARLAGVWALGLVVALGGALLAGGAEAVVVVGGPAPAETAARADGSRTVPVHLGGRLTARLEGEAVALSLGVGSTKVAEASVPLDGRAVPLGDWHARVRDVRPSDEAAIAHVSIRPREGAGPAKTLNLRVDAGVALPDGGRLSVIRLSRDYGRSLGPAAEVQVTWKGGSERVWLFIDHPDLDARVGTSPWIFELTAVEGAPLLELGVRRGAAAHVAMAGWGLMGLFLLAATLFGRRREAAE